MDASKRIIVNTIAQYSKSIINICLSLYSTRLVLAALDIDDYGIYNVVGGVVGILGYLTNSLVVTTQRYLSFYQGAGDTEKVKQVFANSLLIHLAFGLAICLILVFLQNLLVYHFLNMDPARLTAAGAVYIAMVIMLFGTIMTSPFKAMLIAHENIVYISVVEVVDGVLKLLLAISLFVIGLDKLIFYAIGMTCVVLFNLMAYIVYSYLKYDESHIHWTKNTYDKQITTQLLGFAGWTTYGMLAGMCQTQGLSIVFNKFFGTALNAAFGIGSQVNGAVRFVSTSILNAMNPQIMKAEGTGDRSKMLALAGKESKFSTALMLIISIPVIIEMPAILDFWLKKVPANASMFCRALMIAFIVDQLTLGLHAANQATGKLKYYSLLTYTPKIFLVPIAWLVFMEGYDVTVMMSIYVLTEFLVSMSRIPFMKYSANLNIREYIRNVIFPLLPLAVINTMASYCIVLCFDFKYRFLLTAVIGVLFGILTMFVFTISKTERTFILGLVKKKR